MLLKAVPTVPELFAAQVSEIGPTVGTIPKSLVYVTPGPNVNTNCPVRESGSVLTVTGAVVLVLGAVLLRVVIRVVSVKGALPGSNQAV
jgi:hypothetical protein